MGRLGWVRRKQIVEDNMATLKTVTVAAALLAGGASLAMAQNGPPTGGYGGYPGYGYGYAYGNAAPLYDYATPVADLAPPAYGYAPPTYVAPAPLYNYAGAYPAPATAGTTIVIVTPGAPAYAAPPVVGSGYYNYAPGYWGGYRPWRAGYWGGYGYGWR
jgi:hypothetical protein